MSVLRDEFLKFFARRGGKTLRGFFSLVGFLKTCKGPADLGPPGLLCLYLFSCLGDLVGEVLFLFLDTLAFFKADKFFDRDGTAQFPWQRFPHICPGDLAFLHEGLIDKTYILKKIVHAAP
jgi:hypothetical protein